MNLLIATGGTGGHIYPALALADRAMEIAPDTKIMFVGNDDRMEATEIPAHGYAFKGLHASGLTGSVIHKTKALVLMLKAYRQALKIIDECQPDIVMGFGGYVSAPVMLAAYKKNIPTLIHEQNSVVGVANKVVSKYMDKICICYERCYEVFGRDKTMLLGNPRASKALTVPFDETYYTSLGLSLEKSLILVVMGSLGSSSVNEIMVDALAKAPASCQILYVSGKNNYDMMKDKFKDRDIHVVPYVNQLAILKKVDLIVCRAGATTLAEITALGTPSIVIPSPYVANNHQFYNANVLVEHKAAFMIEEKDLNADVLHRKIALIMENRELRKEMHANALAMGFPNASDDIIEIMNQMKR